MCEYRIIFILFTLRGDLGAGANLLILRVKTNIYRYNGKEWLRKREKHNIFTGGHFEIQNGRHEHKI